MGDRLRQQWIAAHILPWEAEVRRWLGRYTLTLRPEDVDDLIQEAYARLWSADFALIKNGRSFLYSVVRNALRDQLRRARVVRIAYVAAIEALDTIDDAPGPEGLMSARQQFELLLRVLEQLTPRRRAIYQLRKFKGLSVQAIAQKLGVAEKTVENLLGRAQAQVIKALFAEGVVPSQTREREYERRTKTDKSKPGRS